MTIDYPTLPQTDQLRQLWKLAFEDEDDFLDLFFSCAFDCRRCRCIEENGQIVSALYWFDVQCAGQSFAYLYAVATLPDHRGKGLCRRLVEDTKKVLANEGFHGILLVPDGEKLTGMYQKMGFSFSTEIREFSCGAAPFPAPLRRLPPEEWARLRRSYLGEFDTVQEDASLTLLGGLCGFYAGENWLSAIGGSSDSLRCWELLGDVGAAPGIVRALGYSKGFFRTPGRGTPFAMVCPLSPDCVKPTYFAFAFE